MQGLLAAAVAALADRRGRPPGHRTGLRSGRDERRSARGCAGDHGFPGPAPAERASAHGLGRPGLRRDPLRWQRRWHSLGPPPDRRAPVDPAPGREPTPADHRRSGGRTGPAATRAAKAVGAIDRRARRGLRRATRPRDGSEPPIHGRQRRPRPGARPRSSRTRDLRRGPDLCAEAGRRLPDRGRLRAWAGRRRRGRDCQALPRPRCGASQHRQRGPADPAFGGEAASATTSVRIRASPRRAEGW